MAGATRPRGLAPGAGQWRWTGDFSASTYGEHSLSSYTDRRRHIPKQRRRVTNWAEYDAGLRARGSLTIWFTAEAVEAWKAEPRAGRGGQPRFSALVIATV